MTDVIDKAKNMTADDLPSPQGTQAEEEADRILRATEHMSTGNVPHGGDDPQHRTNASMTPMPDETGGKGNVGDISMKDDRSGKMKNGDGCAIYSDPEIPACQRVDIGPVTPDRTERSIG